MHLLRLRVPDSHCHSDACASRRESILELSNFPIADVHDIVSPYRLSSEDKTQGVPSTSKSRQTCPLSIYGSTPMHAYVQ